MTEQRNKFSQDLVYYFQQNYLCQLRRKTHQQFQQQGEQKIRKSISTHIPQIIPTANNLFDAYMKERKQKRDTQQKSNELVLKPISKSQKQLNQVLLQNREIIRRHRISSIQPRPDQSLEQIIQRKKSTNLSEIQQRKLIEKCEIVIKHPKTQFDKKEVKQIHHQIIFRETFNRLNGWQIDTEQDDF